MKVTPIRIASLALAVLIGALSIAYVAGWGPGGAPDHEIDRVHDTPPEGALWVLFVGNSHTYRHDVPGQVQRFAEAANTPMWVEQEVVGGASLETHWANTELRRRILKGKWDVVVLQGQSLRPAIEPRLYRNHVGAFGDFIRGADAEPIIYATWARARWSPYYGSNSAAQSPGQLRDQLDESFRAASEEHDVRVAPAGTAWMAFRRQNPAVPLHSEDGNHATAEGAYLAAAVLYRVITDTPVTDVAYRPEGIPPETASQLRRVADESLQRWASQSNLDEDDEAAPAKTEGATPADKTPALAE